MAAEEEAVPSPMQQDETGAVVENTTEATPVENEVVAPAEEVEPDADALRDEKCIPVAREMFRDVANLMIPEDANEKVDYNPVLIALLGKSLDANLNLTTENPYVFQLMLGILAALNVTVQGCDTKPIDDVRYGAIARKILQITADANVTIGPVTPEQTLADFATVKEQINALFAEENLSMLEVKYIMDNIFDSFTSINNGFADSTANSMKQAEERLWKVEDMSDIDMKTLDTVLKTPVE